MEAVCPQGAKILSVISTKHYCFETCLRLIQKDGPTARNPRARPKIALKWLINPLESN